MTTSRCECGQCTVPCERPTFAARRTVLLVGTSAGTVTLGGGRLYAATNTTGDVRNRAARRASMFKRGRR